MVTGDDVLGQIDPGDLTLESRTPVSDFGQLVSANAYLGAEELMPDREKIRGAVTLREWSTDAQTV